MKATLEMVAKMAGVSKACVSKFINNKPYVSKKTSLKIEDAINKLDYKPNLIAKSLAKRKSYSIGLIIRDIENPYYGGIIRGIEEYIEKNNSDYHLILTDIKNISDLADDFFDYLIQRKADGIITTTENISFKCLVNLKKNNVPIIFNGCYRKEKDFNFSYVGINDFQGGYMMTEYLLNMGHKDIMVISPTFLLSFANDRFDGYKKALENSNVSFKEQNLMIIDKWTIQGGNEAARKIFESNKKPSAIFCFSDYIAYGVFNYCYENGIKIPGDISITGFDNNIFSSFSFFNLTTINEPVKKLGYLSAEILFEQIDQKDFSIVRKILKPDLIIRNSVKKI